MRIYKVTITKTVFVRANNKDEAKESALDDDYIMIDECITDVTTSSRREIQKMMFGGDEDD